MNRQLVIFSGFNQRAVIAFLRTLEKNKVSYAIIASHKDDTIFLTQYKDRVVATRQERFINKADIDTQLKVVKERLGVGDLVIAPSTEALNRYFLDNRKFYESAGYIVPLVDKNLYETLSDKKKFSVLCEQEGLTVPAEYKTLAEATTPFVAKPIKYYSSGGEAYSPVLIMSSEEKNKFKDAYEENDFYYQEFIEGSSNYLLYYLYSSGKVVCLSQKNLVQQSGGKSVIAAVTNDLWSKDVAQKYKDLLSKLKFYGLIMVELKYTNGKYYMIEANPRFWGPSQLFVDANINLFEDFLYDMQLIERQPKHAPSAMTARYFWEGGMVETLHSGYTLAFHDYSKEEFYTELSVWRASDVYNKKDTKQLYLKETERS